MKAEPCYFDVILAEGFLKIIGFEVGFVKVISLLKKGGYFVIHDEFKNHEMKCDFIRKNHCDMVGTVFLDKSVWWDDYYRQLEEEFGTLNISKINYLFESEMKEIELYKSDPTPFQSIYYIIRRH